MPMYVLKDHPESIAILKALYTSNDYSDVVKAILLLILENRLSEEHLKNALTEHGIEHIKTLKDELLNVLLAYIHGVLDDDLITENEHLSTEILKRYFKIREGDFYTYKYNEVASILYDQFQRLYADNKIDDRETIHHVYLQALFDLSYDQFDEFKRTEVVRALKEGADFMDLDTNQFIDD